MNESVWMRGLGAVFAEDREACDSWTESWTGNERFGGIESIRVERPVEPEFRLGTGGAIAADAATSGDS
jgi:hypothetical protein